MDQVRKQKIADAITIAQTKENVMNKEASEIFGCSHLVFTYLKKEKYWGNIGRDTWKQLENWMFSGKKLKDYPKADDMQEDNSVLSMQAPILFNPVPAPRMVMAPPPGKPSPNALLAAAKAKARQQRDNARELRKQKGKDKPAPAPMPKKKVKAEIAVVKPEKKEKSINKPGDIIAKLAFEIEILIKLK